MSQRWVFIAASLSLTCTALQNGAKEKDSDGGYKSTFAEAEERDVEYYANLTWKESAANAEQLRRMIWSEEYGNQNIERKVTVAMLKEDRDDFE